MLKKSTMIGFWLIHLFNPPPLESMSFGQRIGRILAVSLSLFAICVLSATVGVLGVFMIQRGNEIVSALPNLSAGLGIVFTGICVNALCVMVLLEIRKADLKPT